MEAIRGFADEGLGNRWLGGEGVGGVGELGHTRAYAGIRIHIRQCRGDSGYSERLELLMVFEVNADIRLRLPVREKQVIKSSHSLWSLTGLAHRCEKVLNKQNRQ